jgi:hypothetical protein
MIDKSLLKVSTADNDAEFLVQAELKAIKQGLQYKEIESTLGTKYYGYVNKEGMLQGVGMRVWPDGVKERGEYNQHKLHGTALITFEGAHTYWGSYKEGKKEGYAI